MKIGLGYNNGGGVPPIGIKYTSIEAMRLLKLFLETSLNSTKWSLLNFFSPCVFLQLKGLFLFQASDAHWRMCLRPLALDLGYPRIYYLPQSLSVSVGCQ